MDTDDQTCAHTKNLRSPSEFFPLSYLTHPVKQQILLLTLESILEVAVATILAFWIAKIASITLLDCILSPF